MLQISSLASDLQNPRVWSPSLETRAVAVDPRAVTDFPSQFDHYFYTCHSSILKWEETGGFETGGDSYPSDSASSHFHIISDMAPFDLPLNRATSFCIPCCCFVLIETMPFGCCCFVSTEMLPFGIVPLIIDSTLFIKIFWKYYHYKHLFYFFLGESSL